MHKPIETVLYFASASSKLENSHLMFSLISVLDNLFFYIEVYDDLFLANFLV